MKATIIPIIIAVVLIGGVFIVTKNPSNGDAPVDPHNVTIEGGKQIIHIRAKGGYQPRKSVAKAGMPSIIRFDTDGTFDCSSSVSIPSMGIRQLLPQSGSTDINLGTQTASTLDGTCAMGMYSFNIDFQS